jgi:adenylate kinase family enzyme
VEWKGIVRGFIAQESWIMDGNYAGTLAERAKAADTIFYFDIPRLRCILGVLKRRVQKKRVDRIKGCPERIDLEFLKWIWNYRKVNHPRVMALLQEWSKNKEVIIFKSHKNAHQYLRNCSHSERTS